MACIPGTSADSVGPSVAALEELGVSIPIPPRAGKPCSPKGRAVTVLLLCLGVGQLH